MLTAKINNTKLFMAHLLKQGTFDGYYLVNADITTFATFSINGILNKSYDDNETNRPYCFWSEAKLYVYEFIKGRRLPKNIKLVLSATPELVNAVAPKASSLFINITFDETGVTLITGCSMKEFSLSRKEEYCWDSYIKDMLAENKVSFTEEEY